MRDFTKKYFHLNSSAVYNSSAKNIKIDCVYLLRGEKWKSDEGGFVYGFDECGIEDDKEVDEDEDEGEVIKEGFDKWGYVFWYDNYHPVGGKRKKNYDTSPYMKVELKKCSIHNYKH